MVEMSAITVSMPAPELDALGSIAHKRGVSRTAVMRHAFRLYMQLQEMEKSGDKLIAVNQRGERELKIVGFVAPVKHQSPRVVDAPASSARSRSSGRTERC